MENNQLEQSIEKVFMAEQCRFKDINTNEIEAVGYDFNSPLTYSKFMHNPLVLQKTTYVPLNPNKPMIVEKTTLIAEIVFNILKIYANKKSNNFLEGIKYFCKPVEDKDSITFEVGYTFTDWQEMTLWPDEMVIPIYQGNRDYELIKNEAIKIAKDWE